MVNIDERSEGSRTLILEVMSNHFFLPLIPYTSMSKSLLQRLKEKDIVEKRKRKEGGRIPCQQYLVKISPYPVPKQTGWIGRLMNW